MMRHIVRLAAASQSVVLLSLLGCNRAPSSVPPTPAQVANEEARSANEALNKLAIIKWQDFVASADTGDLAAISAARAEFLDTSERGFKYLLDRLEQPTTDPAEQLLGLQVLEEMAPTISQPELRTSAVEVLLDSRDRASSKELRDQISQHLAVMLDLAIEADPKNADLFYFRGDERSNRGEHDLAINDLTAAVDLRPTFANAFYVRGLTQRAKGNDSEAIADYTAALGVTPDYPDILVSRAVSYLSLSEPNKAIDDLTAAIRSKPELVHAYQLRAKAYQAISEIEKASADLTKADQLRADKQQQ